MGVSVLKMPSYTVIQDIDANDIMEKDVVGGPCTLHHIHAKNVETAREVAWLKLFNDANPTLGTTAPDDSFELPKATTDDQEDGIRDIPINPPNGMSFPNGLSFACVNDGGGTAGVGAPDDTVEVTLLVVED